MSDSNIVTNDGSMITPEIMQMALAAAKGAQSALAAILKQEQKVSDSLLALYRRIFQVNPEHALSVFEGACKEAESRVITEVYNSDKKSNPEATRKSVKDVLGASWQSAKSVIINGIKADIPVNDANVFQTVSKVKTTLAAKKTAEETAKAAANGTPDATGSERAAKASTDLKIASKELHAAINALVLACSTLTRDQGFKFAPRVTELVAEAAAMGAAPIAQKIAATDEAMAAQNANARREAAKRGGSRAAA